MLFNTYDYFIFLPLTVIIFYLTNLKHRWLVLLSASYIFYSFWNLSYLVLILLSTIVDYTSAIKIYSQSNNTKKKAWLLLSIITNLSILFFFKYLVFFVQNISLIFSNSSILKPLLGMDLILPLGISFYTFQTMAYTIEVYRGRFKPERHFGKFALYVAFFPQLVSGPIERPKNLLIQIQDNPKTHSNNFLFGIKRIIWGLFKKIVIADKLAMIVDPVYFDYSSFDGLQILIATYMFSLQIYFDFSAYCDIAIGSAKIFGFDLSENFNLPYFSKSIKQFWHRWHITLSQWFRDYLYIPLGGTSEKKIYWIRNIIITFIISGLWHGAKWNFIIWGLIHCIYYLFGVLTKDHRNKFYRSIRINNHIKNIIRKFITFNLISFAWIFFRSLDLTSAIGIIRKIGGDLIYNYQKIIDNISMESITFSFQTVSETETIIFIGLMIIFMIIEKSKEGQKFIYSSNTNHIGIKELLIFDYLLIAILLFGNMGSEEFIYFNF